MSRLSDSLMKELEGYRAEKAAKVVKKQAKRWENLTLEEAVERAKGISRQALHIAIKTYTANGRDDIVAQLRQVRKTLKRDKRIAKVGKDVVEAAEAFDEARAERIAEFEATDHRPVKGYEAQWSVTRDGRVWSHSHSKWIKLVMTKPSKKSSKQYVYIGSNAGSLSVHRAVAMSFVPNPENRRNVRHKDKNTSNNHADNLEWWGKKVV